MNSKIMLIQEVVPLIVLKLSMTRMVFSTESTCLKFGLGLMIQVDVHQSIIVATQIVAQVVMRLVVLVQERLLT